MTGRSLRVFGALAAFALATAATQGCAVAHRYPGYLGKVVDMDTKEPLEGAVVLAVYTKHYYDVAGGKSRPMDAEEAVTDAAGEFRLPPNWAVWPSLLPSTWEEHPRLAVFKPGYAFFGGLGHYARYPAVLVEGQTSSAGVEPERHAVFELPRLETQKEMERSASDARLRARGAEDFGIRRYWEAVDELEQMLKRGGQR